MIQHKNIYIYSFFTFIESIFIKVLSQLNRKNTNDSPLLPKYDKTSIIFKILNIFNIDIFCLVTKWFILKFKVIIFKNSRKKNILSEINVSCILIKYLSLNLSKYNIVKFFEEIFPPIIFFLFEELNFKIANKKLKKRKKKKHRAGVCFPR